ncbi:hypothetical protein COLO4_28072 [Corchorus olitorius]|uniref:Uncharacterized protein n=1 Tax=Corchorus olitorius TaxID=93759 RepID=A0A1R3HN04_9ROSI|nr:hypothetical protein COLO4_28072 [Corchorus olitorius]
MASKEKLSVNGGASVNKGFFRGLDEFADSNTFFFRARNFRRKHGNDIGVEIIDQEIAIEAINKTYCHKDHLLQKPSTKNTAEISTVSIKNIVAEITCCKLVSTAVGLLFCGRMPRVDELVHDLPLLGPKVWPMTLQQKSLFGKDIELRYLLRAFTPSGFGGNFCHATILLNPRDVVMFTPRLTEALIGLCIAATLEYFGSTSGDDTPVVDTDAAVREKVIPIVETVVAFREKDNDIDFVDGQGATEKDAPVVGTHAEIPAVGGTHAEAPAVGTHVKASIVGTYAKGLIPKLPQLGLMLKLPQLGLTPKFSPRSWDSCQSLCSWDFC